MIVHINGLHLTILKHKDQWAIYEFDKLPYYMSWRDGQYRFGYIDPPYTLKSIEKEIADYILDQETQNRLQD